MFRLDPKQAVLDHVARKSGAAPGELGPEARAIIAAPIEPNYSSAVIVGVAQAVEALLLATLGFAIFASYVEPGQQAASTCLTILGVVAVRQRAVQCSAHPPHRRLPQRRCSRPGRVLAAWSLVFIVLMAIAFLFKSATSSCRASGSSPGICSAACCSSRSVSRFANSSCSGRPRASSGGAPSSSAAARMPRSLIESIRTGAARRHQPARPVRRSQRRPLAGIGGERPQARSHCRPAGVRAPDPRRSRHRLDAAVGRASRARYAQAALGAAGRYPALGAYEQAALHLEGLFLCRRRAGVRHGRPADLGLEPRVQVAVRQGRRACWR